MEAKNIFILGGSSGIGLEVFKKLNDNQHNLYIGSRSGQFLADYPDVRHLKMDVTQGNINFDQSKWRGGMDHRAGYACGWRNVIGKGI